VPTSQYPILSGGGSCDGAVGRQSGNRIHHHTEHGDAVGVTIEIELIERA
jgi:hypothetical protein